MTSHLDGYLLRRRVALDDLLDAVAAAFAIDRAALVALEDVTEGADVVAYEVFHHDTGFATQLELYRLPRAPDSPAMAVDLARRLDTEVISSPPSGVLGNESPYLWVLARPSGELGLAVQPDTEVIDFPPDVELRSFVAFSPSSVTTSAGLTRREGRAPHAAMRITGTIAFNAFEGGFWGVLGDDGRKYRPTSLPEAFRLEGLRVVIEGERSSAVSFHMWGMAIDVHSIVAELEVTP